MVGRAGLVLGQLLNTAALCRAGFELINELRSGRRVESRKLRRGLFGKFGDAPHPGQLRRSGRGWGRQGDKGAAAAPFAAAR